MKKLIAISVVFALAAGAAFAVDLGGTANGVIKVIDTQFVKDVDPTVSGGGSFASIRLEGAGEAGDGKFGGWIRFDPVGGTDGFDGMDVAAIAWWKPIDQFKLSIGGNGGDGHFGKEGITGWSFNQKANDGIASNPGIWYGDSWGSSSYGGDFKPIHSRYTFFEGFIGSGLMMEIKPFDVLGVNIAIPFIRNHGGKGGDGDELADIFKAIIAQVDLNLPFGNIALTFDGGGRAVTSLGGGGFDHGALFLYYGGSFGDLSIDFGFSFHFAEDWDVCTPPLGIGLGLKYASGAFGIKFKTTVALGGEYKAAKMKDATYLNISLLPYFAINDNICVFLHAGLGLIAPDSGDALVGFFVNPYLRVGGEWGPSFYVGINLETDGAHNKDHPINFKVPIAVMVSF